uniref:Enkurin domain-containing protein n=1 Tax=Strongyloides stercoralis TaxID=6248 RepID=A0A0K0E1R4_STRER
MLFLKKILRMINVLKKNGKNDKRMGIYDYNLSHSRIDGEESQNINNQIKSDNKNNLNEIEIFKSKFYQNLPKYKKRIGKSKSYSKSQIDYYTTNRYLKNTTNIKSKKPLNTAQTISKNKQIVVCKRNVNQNKNCCNLNITKRWLEYNHPIENDSFNEFDFLYQDSDTESSTSSLKNDYCKEGHLNLIDNKKNSKDKIYKESLYQEDQLIQIIKHYDIIIEHLKNQNDKEKKKYRRRIAEGVEEASLYSSIIQKYQKQIWDEKNKLLIENKKVENLKELLLDAYKTINDLKNKLMYAETSTTNIFPELEIKKLCIL